MVKEGNDYTDQICTQLNVSICKDTFKLGA